MTSGSAGADAGAGGAASKQADGCPVNASGLWFMHHYYLLWANFVPLRNSLLLFLCLYRNYVYIYIYKLRDR